MCGVNRFFLSCSKSPSCCPCYIRANSSPNQTTEEINTRPSPAVAGKQHVAPTTQSPLGPQATLPAAFGNPARRGLAADSTHPPLWKLHPGATVFMIFTGSSVTKEITSSLTSDYLSPDDLIGLKSVTYSFPSLGLLCQDVDVRVWPLGQVLELNTPQEDIKSYSSLYKERNGFSFCRPHF